MVVGTTNWEKYPYKYAKEKKVENPCLSETIQICKQGLKLNLVGSFT